ncbi:hypothetical protein AtDm6_3558 [Acetobacter tropicalis]|uniref:Uncharacterized protein n=1 Tax=Acetobacter tropicalis TaxID=104102 RepID=A0A094YJK9_9PROT|nr:hypothetical protein AtDm6_3558 [Acetobacter tropicalis]
MALIAAGFSSFAVSLLIDNMDTRAEAISATALCARTLSQ